MSAASSPRKGHRPSTSALAQLDDLAMTTLERTAIPGMAIAVFFANETPYLKVFGTREAGRDAPVDPNTVFQLASMSKLIASTIVASVLTNASPIGAAETVALEFLDLAQFGAIRRDYVSILTAAFTDINAPPYGTSIDYATPPAAATAALSTGTYAGSFSNDLYGDMTITNEEEGLVLHFGPELRAYPLTHYDRDVFTMQPVGENAYGPSAVTFLVGADDKAERVTIEYLDEHQQGTFVRNDGSLKRAASLPASVARTLQR
jgi:hypothetical protein